MRVEFVQEGESTLVKRCAREREREKAHVCARVRRCGVCVALQLMCMLAGECRNENGDWSRKRVCAPARHVA